MWILRRQHYRGDLGLVADLGQEERDQRSQERAKAPRRVFVVVHLVRHQRPQCGGGEACGEDPVQCRFAEEPADPRTHGASGGMVGQGSGDDAGDDRPGLAEASGENEREQLRLVADFSERNDGGGDEQRFQHQDSYGGGSTRL
ncbi:hypothetical protein D3C79_916570 [compost metagenome]